MRYLDEFDHNELLYYFIANHELEWDSKWFADELLAVAWAELKKAEDMEHYERCHEIKQFIEWVPQRF